ncbi:MAG: hypothetical protein QOH16_1966 [Gaiellaceae bacterium]|nr:hypothetical protein [Gaiellaceae bacterium]
MPAFPPSSCSDHELPGVVADVCRHVDGGDPLSVSQPSFDGARVAAGHPLAPSAKRISVRLGLSWDAVKQLALDPTRNTDRAVGKRTGKEEQPWLTDDVCVAALRTVAGRLGADVPLTIANYENEVERMLAADRRRHVHGRRLVMPTVGQIEHRLGRWSKALVRAGITPSVPAGQGKGVAWIDAIELCLEATGCLCSSKTLVEWFKINDLSLQISTGTRYADEVEKLRVRRAAVGKWTPHGFTTAQQRPDLDTPVPGLKGPKRRVAVYDEARVLSALDEFLRARRGLSQTRSEYVRWSVPRGKPSASSMGEHGRPGFASYRAQARRILREEENGKG